MKNFLLAICLLVVSILTHAQNVGVGISTPLSKLHIYNGASGASPFPFSPLVVENNGHTYINLLSPAANEGAILFGQPGSAANGVLMYNNNSTPNGFQFRNNGNLTRMVIENNGNIGLGLLTPNARLSVSANGTELAGTAASNTFRTLAGVLGSAAGSELSLANIGFSSTNNSSLGIRAYRTNSGTDWTTTALLLEHDVDNTARVNSTYLALGPGGNIGIGTVTPNAPLGFPASLGKKITLYPGATGDVGLAVAGNRLQIYSDNPNADVALGYDAAGTFNERFAVKPNGALAVNGNTGTANQVLQSNGAGATATWVSPTPKTLYYRTNVPATTLTDASPSLIVDVPVTIQANSIITASVTLNVSTGFFNGCDYVKLSVTMEPMNGGGYFDVAGKFNNPCGKTDNTISTGEIPLLLNSSTMKIFGPGTDGVHLRFVKTSTGTADLNIGGTTPAVIIVKVVPQ